MNKTLKKICAVIMTAVTIFSFTALAKAYVCTKPNSYHSEEKTEGIYTYRLSDAGATIIRIEGELTGEVVIPEKLGGRDVVFLNSYLFAAQGKMTSIKLPDTIKFIGAGAFLNCSSLESITIPRNVTVIESGTFEECRKLTKVKLSEGLETIGYEAFRACYNLTEIKFPSTLKTIDYHAFCGCPLKSISLPDKIESVSPLAFESTSFYERESNWENGMLYVGNVLLMIDQSISGKVVVKKGTRLICGGFGSEVTEVILPEGPEKIPDEMFSNCPKITHIELPSTIKEIGLQAFAGCTGLSSLTIPDGVTEIKYGTFRDCSNLKDIRVPESVKTIEEYAFEGTAYLEQQLSVNGALYVNDVLVRVSPEAEGEVIVRDGTVKIAPGAFDNCYSVSSVVLPDSLEEIPSMAFISCRDMKEITIPDKVKKLDLNNFYSGIEIINIGKGVEEIIPCSFDNLMELNVHKDNKAYSSENCVLYNKGKTVLIKSFDRNSTEYTLPLSVTEICRGAFSSTSYKTVNLHDGVKKIHEGAFSYAKCDLEYTRKSVYLGKYLISSTAEKCVVREGTLLIADRAFACAYDMKEIYIPESVRYVGETVIELSNKLVKITVASPYTEFCDCSLSGSGSSKLTIYGYTGSEAQKQAERHGIKFVSIGEVKPLIMENAYIKLDGRTLFAASGVSADRIHKNASVPVEILTPEGKAVTGKTGIATGMVINAEVPEIQLMIIVRGDVDCDGKISASDARNVLRASVGLDDFSADKAVYTAADVEKDGKITSSDAREILRASVGLTDCRDWL